MGILKDGITLIHEHTTIDLSRIKGDLDTRLDCFEETVQEYKDLYNLGVRNIIDVTLDGMGRDVDYVERVSKASGINIVHSTGWYKEPFLPDYVMNGTVEELSEYMINEINNGIEDTGIKAHVIGEIGTSKDVWEDNEKKVFEAAVIAAKATDTVISTHTSLGTLALEQAEFFIERGIDPKRVIIGHQDLSGSIDQVRKLINMGFNVAFDTVGKDNYFPDKERAQIIKQLETEDLLEHITLSLDITRQTNMKHKGGIGYSYLLTDFIPMLQEAGVSEESINLMLVENPKRIFRGEN